MHVIAVNQGGSLKLPKDGWTVTTGSAPTYGSIQNACIAARDFLEKQLEHFIDYGYTQRQVDFVKKKIEDSRNKF